jgi:hypothetical protein
MVRASEYFATIRLLASSGGHQTMGRIAEASPRFKARMAGDCELLEGVTSAFGQVFVLGRLVVLSDAAATAANILDGGTCSCGIPGSSQKKGCYGLVLAALWGDR